MLSSQPLHEIPQTFLLSKELPFTREQLLTWLAQQHQQLFLTALPQLRQQHIKHDLPTLLLQQVLGLTQTLQAQQLF